MERTANHPFLLQLIASRLFESRDLAATLDQVAADEMVANFFSVDFQTLDADERAHPGGGGARRRRATARELAQAVGRDEEAAGAAALRPAHDGLPGRARARRYRIGNWFFERWLRQLKSAPAKAGDGTPRPDRSGDAPDASAKRTVEDERGGASPRRADDASAKRTVENERGGALPRRADDGSAKRTVEDERGGAPPRQADDVSAKRTVEGTTTGHASKSGRSCPAATVDHGLTPPSSWASIACIVTRVGIAIFQAEDLGVEMASYEVRVYDGGTILWRKRFSYARVPDPRPRPDGTGRGHPEPVGEDAPDRRGRDRAQAAGDLAAPRRAPLISGRSMPGGEMRRYAPWLLLLSSCGGVAAQPRPASRAAQTQAILEPVFRYELQQFIGRDGENLPNTVACLTVHEPMHAADPSEPLMRRLADKKVRSGPAPHARARTR